MRNNKIKFKWIINRKNIFGFINSNEGQTTPRDGNFTIKICWYQQYQNYCSLVFFQTFITHGNKKRYNKWAKNEFDRYLLFALSIDLTSCFFVLPLSVFKLERGLKQSDGALLFPLIVTFNYMSRRIIQSNYGSEYYLLSQSERRRTKFLSRAAMVKYLVIINFLSPSYRSASTWHMIIPVKLAISGPRQIQTGYFVLIQKFTNKEDMLM